MHAQRSVSKKWDASLKPSLIRISLDACSPPYQYRCILRHKWPPLQEYHCGQHILSGCQEGLEFFELCRKEGFECWSFGWGRLQSIRNDSGHRWIQATWFCRVGRSSWCLFPHRDPSHLKGSWPWQFFYLWLQQRQHRDWHRPWWWFSHCSRQYQLLRGWDHLMEWSAVGEWCQLEPWAEEPIKG